MGNLRRMGKFIIASSFLLIIIYIPVLSEQITPPEEYLGFKVGADFKLATYEQAIGYYDLLASQSDRMQVFDMGPTSFGRRQKYAVISSAENLANLSKYKEIIRRLSLVEGVSKEEAERLAVEGKAIVWIDGGLHATEVVGSNQIIQLAYDLVTGEDRRTQIIRDNVIALLVFANPDGMTLVADWYMKHVGTKYETSGLPVLYHKYAGHDNNRDSHVGNLIETQNMNRAIAKEWFLSAHYNQHQRGPFPARIWIPPLGEPANPNVHPVVRRLETFIGASMGKALDEADLPGSISRMNYDFWYPGYVLTQAQGHNAPTILTETQSYHLATPHHYRLSDLPEAHQDLRPGIFYPSPWRAGWWRFADQVKYNLTTSKALLEVAANYRYDFLYNKWKVGKDIIERFKEEPPHGWIISADQRDPNTTALLINSFLTNGFYVYTADEPFIQEGISYSEGSYIVPTSQPFGLYIKTLLENQNFPDLRKYPHLWQGVTRPQRYYDQEKGEEILPPLVPYEGAGWTLPVMMGVDSIVINTPLEASKTQITEAVPPVGTVTGSSPEIVFCHSDNYSFTALNRILEEGGKVSWAMNDFTLDGTMYPIGTFIVDSSSISPDKLKEIASETQIPMRAGKVGVSSKPLPKSRIALYESWAASMDAGWHRFLFERHKFPYYSLRDADVRAGNLGERFDVIILPDQRVGSIINGHRKGTMPPKYVGGITQKGVENLKIFVEEGGTLICNHASSDLAIDVFNLPIKNGLMGVPRTEFYSPGSILKMNYDSRHPVAFGMQENGIAFFKGQYLFEILPREEKHMRKVDLKIVGSFPDEPLLISGALFGGERLRGKATVLDVSVSKGRVVLFAFNYQNRAQSNANFKLLFNSIYYR